MKRKDDVIGLNGPIESLVICNFLNGIERLDSCVPVLVLLRAVLRPEGLDDLTATSDGVADEQKPSHSRPLGFRIAVREGSKACVTTTAEYRRKPKSGSTTKVESRSGAPRRNWGSSWAPPKARYGALNLWNTSITRIKTTLLRPTTTSKSAAGNIFRLKELRKCSSQCCL
jgi:hypothetical protein